MDASVLISTDNAHALHPNFSDIHEPNHAPLIGQGVAIKYNANQAYATSSHSSALFQDYAKKADKSLQSYVVRSDTRCGSTIGPITATKLGITTIDIGVPTWGMHSIREMAALKDIDDLIEILAHFFKRS
jgi:aspartyl aminopeptidase